MAQLQGHFMRYKESPETALANVEQLLHQQAKVSMSSLHLQMWLRRLGLEQYYPGFARAKVGPPPPLHAHMCVHPRVFTILRLTDVHC